MEPTHQDNQAAFYQDQAVRYDELYAHRSRTYGLKAKFAKDIIVAKGLTSGTLLEIGCGTGLFTQKLAEELPYLNILATDAYQPMLRLAQKRLGNCKNVKCQLFDAETDSLFKNEADKNQVDIVCGVDILHHIDTPTAALRTWKKMTKPNGILLFLECNPANPAMYIRHYNRPEEKRLYLNNKKNLTSWVEAAGWKNVVVKNMPTYLPSGPKKMWNMLTATEEFIHKIPFINRMSALFLVYAENR